LNYETGVFGEEFDRTIVATMADDATDASTNWSITTNLSAGDYRLFALALDTDGNEVEKAAGDGVPENNGRFWTTRAFTVVDDVVPTVSGGIPTITSPETGDMLNPATTVVSWNNNDLAVSEWWIYAGSSGEGRDRNSYFSSGAPLPPETRSTVVTGLPNDGSPVYLTLWYKPVNRGWESVSTRYFAADGGGPAISTPSQDDELESGMQTFEWAANGAVVDEYWLFVGKGVNQYEYYNSALGDATSAQVFGLPVDGTKIYVRLWHRAAGGRWQYVDSSYTAIDNPSLLPSITIPTGDAISSSQLFTWTNSGTTVDEWWLFAGSTPGGSEFYDSGSLADATSATTANLPSGSTAFITLWYRATGGVWGSSIYQCEVE